MRNERTPAMPMGPTQVSLRNLSLTDKDSWVFHTSPLVALSLKNVLPGKDGLAKFLRGHGGPLS